MTLGWFRGLLWLTRAEFSRIVRAPAGLYFFVGAIAFLGLFYWFLATYRVAYFLDLAYATLPVFFLAIGSTLISKERESGFMGILFTHPIESSQHYFAKILSIELLAGLYLAALVPFDVLIVYFAGPGWVTRILARAGWTLLTTFFVGSLALFISTALGRRATLPSVSLGFVVAMVLVWSPFLVLQYLGTFDPSIVPRILALLRISPTMGAMDLFRSEGLLLSQPMLPILVTGVLTVFLTLVGLLVYTRLQGPEGWEVPRRVRIAVSTLVLVVLVATPLAAPFVYETPLEWGGGNTTTFGDLLFHIGSLRPTAGEPRVGTSFDALLRISAQNGGPTAVTLNRFDLSWRSEYFDFNVTSVELGPATVPPVSTNQSLEMTIPIRMTALFTAALGTGQFFASPTPVLIELRAESQGSVFTWRSADQSLRPQGPEYNRDIAWLLVASLSMGALGLRAIARVRRRKT
jgi:ABC-type transport system involved in multi-copper enzyme maturation permease subunit